MIIVHGTFPIKPDQRSQALELMRTMSSASQAEYGCVTYEFYVGLTDPNTLLLFQEWESVDALQGHFQTDHMDEFLKLLPEVLDGDVSTRRYEVRSSDEIGDADMSELEPEVGASNALRNKIIH
ncbi:MAG: putative quinol monooxygenase [Pseudomonadales bacterium]|jgi:quinol monooxygenase YgiN|tara:strand:+ start:3720 stop:4091 length:372 start_codon:yes stop_codon:yes gene_type:complete